MLHLLKPLIKRMELRVIYFFNYYFDELFDLYNVYIWHSGWEITEMVIHDQNSCRLIIHGLTNQFINKVLG